MSLDPDDDNVILTFEYRISFDKINDLKTKYIAESEKFDNKPHLFLKENLAKYFGPIVKKAYYMATKTNL